MLIRPFVGQRRVCARRTRGANFIRVIMRNLLWRQEARVGEHRKTASAFLGTHKMRICTFCATGPFSKTRKIVRLAESTYAGIIMPRMHVFELALQNCEMSKTFLMNQIA